MRSSRNRCQAPLLATVLVLFLVDDVLQVADAFLRLAFRLVGEALGLLAAVAGHGADLLARLAGDVLHVALGLILVHKHSCKGRNVLYARSRPRAYVDGAGGVSGCPG